MNGVFRLSVRAGGSGREFPNVAPMAPGMVVRGGTVVTSDRVRVADVVVSDAKVAAVVAPGSAGSDGMTTFDAGGLLVLPGMVDAHVHFQEPGREEWEGFDTGGAAAAAGESQRWSTCRLTAIHQR